MKPPLEALAIPQGPAPQSASERWLLALMAIFLLYVLIFAAGGIGAAIKSANPRLPMVPHDPLHLLVLTFLLAQYSLAAIGLGVSRLAGYVKALAISAVGLVIWALLLMLLELSDFRISSAGSLLVAMATQGYLIVCGAFGLQTLYDPPRAASARRFTILLLLIWTTLVAGFLGSVRWLAESLGWEPNVLAWPYLRPLLVQAVFSAILALLLHWIVSRRTSWRRVAACSLGASFATVAVFVLVITKFIAEPDAKAVDLWWLIGSQALFLLAVLVPLHTALAPDSAQASAATQPAATSPQTPPPPDSGR